MGLVPAKCPSCGAQISVDESKEAGICQYCGTPFVTEKVINNYVTNVSNNFDGAIINVYGPKTETMLKNGKRMYEDGNYKEAYDVFTQILNNDPDCADAILYRGLCAAWQSTVADCRVFELNNAYERSFKIAKQNFGNTEYYFSFTSDAVVLLSQVTSAIYDMYIRYLSKMKKTATVNLLAGSASGISINARAKENCFNGIHNIAIVNYNALMYIYNNAKNIVDSDNQFKKNFLIIAGNAVVYLNEAKKYKSGTDDTNLLDGLCSLIEEFDVSKEQEELYSFEERFVQELLRYNKKMNNETISKYKSLIDKHPTTLEKIEQERIKAKGGLATWSTSLKITWIVVAIIILLAWIIYLINI